ncbi:MAG: hypothetical protein ACLTZT_10775 [Butyricimonas faecalis]
MHEFVEAASGSIGQSSSAAGRCSRQIGRLSIPYAPAKCPNPTPVIGWEATRVEETFQMSQRPSADSFFNWYIPMSVPVVRRSMQAVVMESVSLCF